MLLNDITVIVTMTGISVVFVVVISVISSKYQRIAVESDLDKSLTVEKLSTYADILPELRD